MSVPFQSFIILGTTRVLQGKDLIAVSRWFGNTVGLFLTGAINHLHVHIVDVINISSSVGLELNRKDIIPHQAIEKAPYQRE